MNLVPFPLARADRKIVFRLCIAALLIALLTIAVDAAIIVSMGSDSPTGGDGPYYIGIAKSLAANHGYYLEKSFWPNQPEAARSPLWPVILTLPALVFSGANENAILRYTGAFVHGLSAALLALLTFHLTGTVAASALAGTIFALYPPASGLVMGGYSELAYLMVMFGGIILLLEGGRKAYAGAVLCGAGVLGRSNYILTPLMLILLLIVFRPKVLIKWRTVRLIAVGSVLFGLLPAIWIVRNYLVSGYFPILSAMEGETLYGGNNERVASDLSVWGYWIMPNEIPGEKTKHELAQTRTEFEVNKYYHDKAMDFIRANWYALPRLIVGKLVRGFVPVPWVPLATSYIAFFFRGCVYVAFVAAWIMWPERNAAYSFLVGAMFLVTLATTIVYYGTFRFTFCVEPFLFPFIAGAAISAVRARAGRAMELTSGVHSSF